MKVWPTSLISNKDLPLPLQWLHICILQKGVLYSCVALNVSLLALLLDTIHCLKGSILSGDCVLAHDS